PTLFPYTTLFRSGCDDGRVVAKGVGMRERGLRERTAWDRRPHDLNEDARERRAGAAFADVTADQEARREPGVDPTHDARRVHRVSRVERVLAAVPLTQPAGARRDRAELRETHLHRAAVRGKRGVVAGGVGHAAAEEDAAW